MHSLLFLHSSKCTFSHFFVCLVVNDRYHRLMNGLIPLLAASGGNAERRKMVPFARIVNVASQYTTSLTNDPGKNFNLKKAPKRYDSNEHYKKSKAANRYENVQFTHCREK